MKHFIKKDFLIKSLAENAYRYAKIVLAFLLYCVIIYR